MAALLTGDCAAHAGYVWRLERASRQVAVRLLPAERCSAGAAVEDGRCSSRAVGRSINGPARLPYLEDVTNRQ
eukprot:2979288-Prymnesium_polylepis.1